MTPGAGQVLPPNIPDGLWLTTVNQLLSLCGCLPRLVEEVGLDQVVHRVIPLILQWALCG